MKKLAKELKIKEQDLKDYVDKCLENNEKDFFYLRFVNNKTLFEIASILKLNLERVRQIEAKTLRKIRGNFIKEK